MQEQQDASPRLIPTSGQEKEATFPSLHKWAGYILITSITKIRKQARLHKTLDNHELWQH